MEVFRHKHLDLRQYTFHKKQVNNYTRARLDYFLMNEDSLEMVKKVGIGKSSPLSDHRPIYLHLSLSKVQRGRGFWRLNGELLYDPAYIFGYNEVIRKTILQHCATLASPLPHITRQGKS